MKIIGRRVTAVLLAAVLTLGLAACAGVGGRAPEENGAEGTGAAGTAGSADGGGASAAVEPEWVYVPEYRELTDENGVYYSARLAGDYLYYVRNRWDEETGNSDTTLCRYSLMDDNVEELPVSFGGAGNSTSVNSLDVAEDGSIYAVRYVWQFNQETGEGKSRQELAKYDASGSEVYWTDITAILTQEMAEYMNGIASDSQGRVYLGAGNGKVLLFDASGEYKGALALGDGSAGGIAVGRGRDGNVYAREGFGSGKLIRLDFERRGSGEVYENYSGGSGSNLSVGVEKDFLMHDGARVYEYDMAARESTPLFAWLDCDINGSCVLELSALSDGRIVGLINNWETNESRLVLLTKKSANEVEQRKSIVIGTMSSGTYLRDAAAEFNKSNGQYRVTIKEYMAGADWGDQNAWQDARTRMNAEIVSGGCPDILDLTYLDAETLSGKGLFEDIRTFLDQSDSLKRDDFIESVVEACTYDGVWIGVPKHFTVRTLGGRSAQVGDEMGWSVEEFLNFVEANPGKKLVQYESRSLLLSYILNNNPDYFVDWESGTCRFDSPEFIEALTFAGQMPDGDGMMSENMREELANGEILLCDLTLTAFDDVQLYAAMLGGEDLTLIGFPTIDGSARSTLYINEAYGITAKSDNKDGAWAFLEYYLQREDNNHRWDGFPARRDQLERMREDAIEVEYVLDSNGDPFLDSNGEPVMVGGSTVSYADGWSYSYRATRPEEADQVMEAIEAARSTPVGYQEILSVVWEEIPTYFDGSKTAEEVARIIQNRVKIYVSENS